MVENLIRAKLRLKNNLLVDCQALRFILMRWTVIYTHQHPCKYNNIF